MFTCGICNLLSAPNEKATRVTLRTRPFQHPHRSGAHRLPPASRRDALGFRTRRRDDPGGLGSAIVTEVLAHASCAERRAAALAALNAPPPPPLTRGPLAPPRPPRNRAVANRGVSRG